MPVDKVERALAIVQEPMPLEESTHDREAYDVADWVADGPALSPFHHASQLQIAQRVESILRELDPREQTILRLRFGIGGDVARTLEQVGERLRLSRERVRQIEWRAIEKIKASPVCRDLAELFGVRGETDPPPRREPRTESGTSFSLSKPAPSRFAGTGCGGCVVRFGVIKKGEPLLAELIAFAFESAGHDCLVLRNIDHATRILHSTHVDSIVLGLRMPGWNGLDWLESMATTWPDLPSRACSSPAPR
jgi:hypothetical protein